MGSKYNSNISRVDVSKSPSGQQSVVYTTSDSRTCTLLVKVGVDSATVTLRDYTYDRKGTRVELRVSDAKTNKEGVTDVGTVDCKNRGSALDVLKDAEQFRIGYGVPNVRFSCLAATKLDTRHGRDLLVTQLCYSKPKFFLVVAQVWYDAGKGSFMCNMMGPSQHSSLAEVFIALLEAFIYAVGSLNSTGQRSSTPNLINNSGGPFCGPLNGSMINDSMINFFSVFLKNKSSSLA